MTDWLDQPKDIRSGEELSYGALENYLQQQLDVSDNLIVSQFPSGYSNLTYMLKLGTKELVLRRPPIGANIKSGHDMLREYSILDALKNHFIVPQPLLYSEDSAIIGSPFYIMERLKGVILRAGMPNEMVPDENQMKEISKSWVRTFVDLHNLNIDTVGLTDFGKPIGYIGRQVGGWIDRYKKAKTNDIPTMENVANWMFNNQPKENSSCLIHNDFKYDNVVLDPENWSNIIGVLDWEMATIGNPNMDLGTSLGYWVDTNDPPELHQLQLNPTTSPGNPSREEVLSLYEEYSGRTIDDPVFYYVFGLFKIAVIAQQIYARYKAGITNDSRFEKLIYGVRLCSKMATQAIQKKQISNLY